jgi:lipopolysaccharide export system permease protein
VSARIGGRFFRHVLREMAITTGGVAAVLLVLLVTNQLAFVLGRAADGQIPSSLVLELVALSASENVVVILPVSLLIGVIVALGRLYHDSELAAAQACGVGPGTLYGAAGIVTLVAVAITATISFVTGPLSAQRTFEIRSDAIRTASTRGLVPGQFRSMGGGAVLFFRELGADGTLRQVFFQRRLLREGEPDRGRIEVVLADSASYTISEAGDRYTVVLRDGQRHEGIPGQGAWRSMRFREQVVPIPTPEATLPGRPRVDLQSTAALRASPDPRFRAEYHWRLSTVLITAIVGLLAVPIARLRPRQGRYARVVWGVLLYAIYANLLIAGRTLIEQGGVPDALGLWWVHGLVVAVTFALLASPRLLHRLRFRTPAH